MSRKYPHMNKILLRCYVHPHDEGDRAWEAVCVDLCLSAVGKSREAATESLREAIQLHLEAVNSLLDSDPAKADLLDRRAPWRDVARWHLGRSFPRWSRLSRFRLAPFEFKLDPTGTHAPAQ